MSHKFVESQGFVGILNKKPRTLIITEQLNITYNAKLLYKVKYLIQPKSAFVYKKKYFPYFFSRLFFFLDLFFSQLRIFRRFIAWKLLSLRNVQICFSLCSFSLHNIGCKRDKKGPRKWKKRLVIDMLRIQKWIQRCMLLMLYVPKWI